MKNSYINKMGQVIQPKDLEKTIDEINALKGDKILYLHTITFTSKTPVPFIELADVSIITATNATLENKTDITDTIASGSMINASLSLDEGENRYIILGTDGVAIYYLDSHGKFDSFNIGYDWTIVDTVTAL